MEEFGLLCKLFPVSWWDPFSALQVTSTGAGRSRPGPVSAVDPRVGVQASPLHRAFTTPRAAAPSPHGRLSGLRGQRRGRSRAESSSPALWAHLSFVDTRDKGGLSRVPGWLDQHKSSMTRGPQGEITSDSEETLQAQTQVPDTDRPGALQGPGLGTARTSCHGPSPCCGTVPGPPPAVALCPAQATELLPLCWQHPPPPGKVLHLCVALCCLWW